MNNAVSCRATVGDRQTSAGAWTRHTHQITRRITEARERSGGGSHTPNSGDEPKAEQER